LDTADVSSVACTLITIVSAYNPVDWNRIDDFMAKASGDRALEMTTLVAAAEHGGFSAAARSLGVTPSAVSKAITRLESRLGVRLLNRTTRRLTPTAEGETLIARGRHILAELDEAEMEVTRARGAPRGLLRLHTLVGFGLHSLPAVLPEFLRRYPELQIELSISDRLVDLVEEGGDLAVRSGRLADSTLVARKICDTERMICAAPSYLKRHGTPRRPEDLQKHNCIIISGYPQFRRWPFDDPSARDGIRLVEVSGNVSANNAENVLQMALLGLGIIRLGDLVTAEHVNAGRLVPILTDRHHVERLPLHAVYPQSRLRSPKVAAMVDFLIEKFAHAPWRVARQPRRRSVGRA
jgi:DNA-binding transcriptional LysR family regulator